MALAGRLSGPEFHRYADPATELDVTRLTDPVFSSGMTAPHLRQFGRRTDTLLYWSDRFGPARQAFQLDLRSGESHQLTDVPALDCASLALSADEKSFYYFDGASLFESPLNSLRARERYRVAAGRRRSGLTVAADGSLLFAEDDRIVRVTRNSGATVLQAEGKVEHVAVRPRHPQVLYRTAAGLSVANLDGSGRQRLPLEAGRTGEAVWAQSGNTLLYLHVPEDARELITLREYDPASGTDALISKTTQFESVAGNANASVFVGASRSVASAYVLLLLRVTKRELTLCEHRASDPRMVQPVFSPDSQSVFFTSDRHGRQAIYRMRVEKFVESTEQQQQKL